MSGKSKGVKLYSGKEAVLCPNCNGDYIHHKKVEIFNREIEDSVRGEHIVHEGEKIIIDREMIWNPSKRRDGILITFYCENCPAEPVLSIVQHKGCTFMDWLYE